MCMRALVFKRPCFACYKRASPAHRGSPVDSVVVSWHSPLIGNLPPDQGEQTRGHSWHNANNPKCREPCLA